MVDRFLDNSVVPSVKLPSGAFFAWGAGGQLAFVIPAYDLAVVHRAPHIADGGPSLREFGRLLWLVLDAAHLPDIGPDASIEMAHGTHLDGATLKQVLPGKTLIVGEDTLEGPYHIRLNADGNAAALKGREPVQYDSGTWSVEGDRFCRQWEKTRPHRQCLTAVVDADHLELFDDNGLMFVDARLSDD